jgi:hypothetical protein
MRTITEENTYLSQKWIAQALFFHHNIVLDSLKKKFAQVPDPNSEQGHFTFG